jgi:hypothetical protein
VRVVARASARCRGRARKGKGERERESRCGCMLLSIGRGRGRGQGPSGRGDREERRGGESCVTLQYRVDASSGSCDSLDTSLPSPRVPTQMPAVLYRPEDGQETRTRLPPSAHRRRSSTCMLARSLACSLVPSTSFFSNPQEAQKYMSTRMSRVYSRPLIVTAQRCFRSPTI